MSSIILPQTLHNALWEHCDLTHATPDAIVATLVREWLIRQHGDDYGCIMERLDKYAGMDERHT